MSRRLIGQEGLSFAPTSRSLSTLDRLSELINWTPVVYMLEPLYPANKGEPAWRPLAMFKALLLAVWHDLSDVKLAEALEDRASFGVFVAFSSSEPTPERALSSSRHRAWLDRVLFERVTADLKARAITVKTGTLVDATRLRAGGCLPPYSTESRRTKCFPPALALRVNAISSSRRIASERFGWSS